MLTTSHAAWVRLALRTSAGRPWAVAGAVAPDLPATVLTGAFLAINRGIKNLPDGVYERSPWREVHRSTHSLLAPAVIAAFPTRRGRTFAAGWATHLAIDYLTHHDDAWSPLWPLTETRWAAPVSYWQVDHHARGFAALDASGLLVGAFVRRDAISVAAASVATAMLMRLVVAPGNPLSL